jgi:ABC-type multidrug transport system fused ATPase/permease subunit
MILEHEYVVQYDILERGSHDDLMRLDGKYAEMYRVQAKKYRTAS